MKPHDVFARDDEWADLIEFAASDLPGLRVAIVYGRRRQGKSYLLRRLAQARRGLYHLATEQTEAVSVRRFAASLADWLGMPRAALAFDGWEGALSGAVSLMSARTEQSTEPALLVLDEFPYLAHETPGLPSMIQGLYDEFGPGGTNPVPLRLILCGSAISIMSDLLSGTKALRGRAALDMRVKPFGFRESREYWKIGNVESAFIHNALFGGTPGYRELVPDPAVPEQSDRIGDWVARNVLRSTVPLFSEASRVVHEDPRIRDTAVYGSLMATIAAGESSPSKIGGLLGRPASSLTYQLGMLESAGFIERRRNLLVDRRPAIAVADPVVRFHHLVIEPHMAELEDGRAEHVWIQAQRTLESKILGPHFEALATEWLTRYGRDEADVDVGETGPATIACREHKTSHEVDILSIRSGERAGSTGAAISFIGEAKCRDRQPGAAELERLEHLRDLLESSGHDCRGAALGLFSRTGFTNGLWSKVKTSHSRVLLADLVDLYGGWGSSKP